MKLYKQFLFFIPTSTSINFSNKTTLYRFIF